MITVPFTQYIMPDGRVRTVSIEVSGDLSTKVKDILDAGLTFECEVLTTGQVSMTITSHLYGDLDIRVVPNGPGVREAVESLINGFKIPEGQQ